jgi:hypothetical protein
VLLRRAAAQALAPSLSQPGRRLRRAELAFKRQPTMTPEWELLMADTSCAYLLLFLSGDFFSLAMSSSGSVAFSASTSGCRYWTARAPGGAGVTRTLGIERRE